MAKSWAEVLVAKAQGREVDPEELAEVRRAGRPPETGWAAAVADQAQQRRRPRREGETFRSAILERLGVAGEQDDDGPPPAA